MTTNAKQGTDIVRAVHFSPVCACGGPKKAGYIFCDQCWSRMSFEMREEWNCLVLTFGERVKRSKRVPYTVRTFYRRVLTALIIPMPEIKDGRLTVKAKVAKAR